MRKLLPYCLLLLLVSCNNSGLNLRETYRIKDPNPFGTSYTWELIANYYSGISILETNKPFRLIDGIESDTSSMYFCFSKNYFASEIDTDVLMSFVESGNTAFIAATAMDSLLLSRLSCDIIGNHFGLPSLFYRVTGVSLSPEILEDKSSFNYFYEPMPGYFDRQDSVTCRIAGVNEAGKPNCLVFFIGKGKLILHCEPRVFSNYFLLTRNNQDYLVYLLGILPTPEFIYWDQYYNNRNVASSASSGSALSELFKYHSLRSAFWMFAALILVYVIFNLKRKQRIIPLWPKNENSSVAFAETIGRLYLQQKDHKNITEKMIAYFYEYLHRQYYIPPGVTTKDMVTVLSRKSGVPEYHVTSLFRTIDEVRQQDEVATESVLELNDKIQQFFKFRK